MGGGLGGRRCGVCANGQIKETVQTVIRVHQAYFIYLLTVLKTMYLIIIFKIECYAFVNVNVCGRLSLI
jgi:hypothetical protein